MGKFHPTFNDIALASPTRTLFTPLPFFRATIVAAPFLVAVTVRYWTSPTFPWLSWLVTAASVPLAALAIKAWLSPAEVERRRVVDLLPNDLVVPPNEGGFLTSAIPVLSRNTILDASPQVEVVLAGRNHPLIYGCEGEVGTIQPIDLKSRPHSSEETGMVEQVLAAATQLDDNWFHIAIDDEQRIARRLGLVEKKPLRGGERWSKAAKSYANAARAEHTDSQQDTLTQTGSVIVIVNGDLMLQIDGQEQRIADLVDRLAEKVTQLTDRAIVERIRVAVDQKDTRSTAQGLRELGQDTLVNALGAASGNALWTAVLTGMQHFW